MSANILIFIAILLGMIALSVYQSVQAMARMPEPQPKPELAELLKAEVPPDIAAFLATKGFSFSEAYGFHNVRFGIWTQPGSTAPLHRFCLSRTQTGGTEEFVTDFSDEASLTTTRTRSAFVLPRVWGGFLQAFPKAPVQELWELHQQGVRYLTSDALVPVHTCRLPYVQRLTQGMARQIAYVQSLPLWPVRGVYWFLVQRFLMHNRPVWKQNLSRTYPPVPGSGRGG